MASKPRAARSKKPSAPRAEPHAASPLFEPAPRREPRALPLRRKLAFSVLICTAILLAAELALRAVGVAPAHHTRDPYAGFTSAVPHFTTTRSAGGPPLVTVVPSKLESLNPQSFPAKKPAGTVRIVCLGGSSVYGRPFWDHTSFPGWLRAMLPAADPSHRFEVINAGAISYASYRVEGLMRELAAYQPDVFIVQVGHNEFLERRTYAGVLQTSPLLRNAVGLASRLRLATVSQRAFQAAGLISPPAAERATGLNDEVTRIPLDAVGPEAYTRDEAFRQQVLAHYEATLRDMAATARQANVRLLLVTPASNLLDFAPFKSELSAGLSPAQRQAFEASYQRGLALAAQGQHQQALAAFEKALAIDSRHAELLYRAGLSHHALGQYDQARDFLVRARDEDICPLRAITPVLDTIRRVAASEQLPLVDFERILSEQAGHGIPGEREFHDHVHQTIAANRVEAVAILDELARLGVVQKSVDWGDEALARVTEKVEAGIDGPKYARELFTLARLFQYLKRLEQALHRVQEGLAFAPGDPDGLAQAGALSDQLGQRDQAASYFRQALAASPQHLAAREGLGGLLIDQNQPREALELLLPVVRAQPQNVQAINRVDVAQALLGQHAEAVAMLRQALALSPNDPAIACNLALAQERQGDRAGALVTYQRVLSLQPSHQEARAALLRLQTAAPQRR